MPNCKPSDMIKLKMSLRGERMSLMRIIVILAALLILCGCRKQSDMVRPDRDPAEQTEAAFMQINEKAQLLCAAESREAAEELAELYGIVLVDYGNGYACFFTEEDPNEVILRGKAQGWPVLSLNRKTTLS